MKNISTGLILCLSPATLWGQGFELPKPPDPPPGREVQAEAQPVKLAELVKRKQSLERTVKGYDDALKAPTAPVERRRVQQEALSAHRAELYLVLKALDTASENEEPTEKEAERRAKALVPLVEEEIQMNIGKKVYGDKLSLNAVGEAKLMLEDGILQAQYLEATKALREEAFRRKHNEVRQREVMLGRDRSPEEKAAVEALCKDFEDVRDELSGIQVKRVALRKILVSSGEASFWSREGVDFRWQ